MAFFGLGKKKVELLAPFAGEVVALDEVPDPVFSGRMLGDGVALRPAEDATVVTVVAPVAGRLVKVFKTGHAFALVTPEGVEVLVHVGLETVERKGEGFDTIAATGDEVAAGDPVVSVDVASLRAAGYNLITPVVFTKRGQVASVDVHAGVRSVGETVGTATLA
ncbi:MAG: glucose PTS transporter subunit IIA [Propionibacteriaceae bacterium]|nr:glucose PTS transporter subunit IIA [Propionibacteriaceae bacterium]